MENINYLNYWNSGFVLKYNISYKCTNYLSLFSTFQKALSFQGVEALYLLTDGKPDTSCNLILKEIERLIKKQDIKIHTICFSCADRYMILWKNKTKISKWLFHSLSEICATKVEMGKVVLPHGLHFMWEFIIMSSNLFLFMSYFWGVLRNSFAVVFRNNFHK